MSSDQIKARASTLAERFYAVVVSLGNISGAINDAVDSWNAVVGHEAKLRKYKDEELRKRRETGSDEAEELSEDDDDDEPKAFPHKGKHAPKKTRLTEVRQDPSSDPFPDAVLKANTVGSTAAAYKTRNTPTVARWGAGGAQTTDSGCMARPPR